jgi:hypothetical protein
MNEVSAYRFIGSAARAGWPPSRIAATLNALGIRNEDGQRFDALSILAVLHPLAQDTKS